MRKHKILLMVIFTVLLVLILSFSVFSKSNEMPFEDIPENAWYRESAEFCYANEIIKGQGNEYTFAPDAPLTRAIFTVMLTRGVDADISGYEGKNSFIDCPVGAWYTESVEWAYDKGYVKGTSEDKFSPDISISREEAAVILSRVLALKAENDSLSAYIDAEEVSIWAKDSVNSVLGAKLMGSTSAEKLVFSPKMTMTRAQASKILMSVLKDHVHGDCKHSLISKDCEEEKKCAGCGLIMALPRAHVYSLKSCAVESVCDICSHVRKAGHEPIYKSCTEDTFCSFCNEFLPAKGHSCEEGVCDFCHMRVFACEYDEVYYHLTPYTSTSNLTFDYRYPNNDKAKLKIYVIPSTQIISITHTYYWEHGSYYTMIISIMGKDKVAFDMDYYSHNGLQSHCMGDIVPESMTYTFTYSGGNSQYLIWLDNEMDHFVQDTLFLLDVELNKLCGCGISAFGF